VSITLQPDEKSGVSAADGILYQISGSTEVSLGGEAALHVLVLSLGQNELQTGLSPRGKVSRRAAAFLTLTLSGAARPSALG